MNDIDSGVSAMSAFGEATGVTFEAELLYSLRKLNTYLVRDLNKRKLMEG